MNGFSPYHNRHLVLVCLMQWLAAVTAAAVVAIGGATTGQAADWTDTRAAGPFVCRADFSLTPCQGLLGELAQLQADLVRTLRVPPAGEPIEVYLFHDQATYARYLGHCLPTAPYRRALYAKGRGPGRVFAYQSEQFAVDLRHECTHALLHAALGQVPLWLDEGLAGYFELPAAKRAFDNPHLGCIRSGAEQGFVPSLEALEKKDDPRDMGQAAYRDSWAWTHFMLHGPPAAHEALVAYLAELRGSGAGVPTPALKPEAQARFPERGSLTRASGFDSAAAAREVILPQALSTRLRQQIPDLHQRFLEHFQSWKR